MKTSAKILLLREARELENAGSRWRQTHAAVIAGYSPSFLRGSDCPKHIEPGNGPHGKPIVFYVPLEVREWIAKRNAASKVA